MPIPPSKGIIGEPFTQLTTIDSTNNYAMALAQQGFADHGHAWFAAAQTAGKGQRGKSWAAAPGENILLSVLLDTSWLALSQSFHLSLAIGVAVHDWFSLYAGEETRLKWPNDLYWRDRKAGGILIETLVKGHIWQCAVAGIGINVNQVYFDTALANPVSLKQITGKTWNSVNMAKELCRCLDLRYRQLQQEGVAGLLQRFNEVLYKKGQQVQLKKTQVRFNCTIDRVDENGRLWLLNSPYPVVDFGEVRWEQQ